MSYLGNVPSTSFETVRKQVSTSNSGTTITLDFPVTNVQDILVTVDAVIQSYDNYSVSSNTLQLNGTLNNNRVEILYVGRTFGSVNAPDNSVTKAQLQNGIIDNSKIESNASIATTKLGAGAVLQVVQTVDTTNRSSNSTSIVSSGVELNITPSSTSNKIYLHADFSVGLNTDNRRNHKFTFLRDTTDLTPAGVNALHNPVFTGTNALFHLHPVSMSFLDSPSTTSQITYKLAWSINADTHYLGRRGQDTGHDAPTILTAMEIAG